MGMYMHGHGVAPRCRMQGIGWRWSARRCSNAVGIRGTVRKHDCALPAQYIKHSNARGVSLVRVRARVRVRIRTQG